MNREVPNGADEMFAGLVGQVVDTFAPYTEAHPTAIAAHFIVGFGNAVGPGPHFFVGETVHHMNEFLLVVKIRCLGNQIHDHCLPSANGCATPGARCGAHEGALSTDNIVQTDWATGWLMRRNGTE